MKCKETIDFIICHQCDEDSIDLCQNFGTKSRKLEVQIEEIIRDLVKHFLNYSVTQLGLINFNFLY